MKLYPQRWRLIKKGRLFHLEKWSGDEPASGALFQEHLRAKPFWMLVACSLVNLTTWEQARPAFDWLRATYPSPSHLAAASPEDLHEALRPLGLWRRRSTILTRLAQEWLRVGPPSRTMQIYRLPGCGKYAADSWAIFVEGRTDVEPTDGKLSWYLSQLRSRECPKQQPKKPSAPKMPS